MSDSLVHFTVSERETKNKRANCSLVPSFTYCVAWRFGPGAVDVTRNTNLYGLYNIYIFVSTTRYFRYYDQIQTQDVVQNSDYS